MSLAINPFFLSGVCFAALALLNSCNHPRSLPATEPKLTGLSSTEPPVKTVIDTVRHRTYWLSFVGEVYRSQPDGSQPECIIQGVGTHRAATFIEDFCLDQSRQHLFFTDLWDQTTGQSAIKQMNLVDGRITTVALLNQEIPYQLQLDAVGDLYYLTKSESMRGKTYRLRTLNEEEPLAMSSRKMENIAERMAEYQKRQLLLAQTKTLTIDEVE